VAQHRLSLHHVGRRGLAHCFRVLVRLLAGQPTGRIVGADAMKFVGWQRLNAEYARLFLS
jgi:hypothetical protein